MGILLIIIYSLFCYLNRWNLLCPIGHKWKYWQLIENSPFSQYRICKRCKIEMKGSPYSGGMSWYHTVERGTYEKYKNIVPIPIDFVINKIIEKRKNRTEKDIIIEYKKIK